MQEVNGFVRIEQSMGHVKTAVSLHPDTWPRTGPHGSNRGLVRILHHIDAVTLAISTWTPLAWIRGLAWYLTNPVDGFQSQ